MIGKFIRNLTSSACSYISSYFCKVFLAHPSSIFRKLCYQFTAVIVHLATSVLTTWKLKGWKTKLGVERMAERKVGAQTIGEKLDDVGLLHFFTDIQL